LHETAGPCGNGRAAAINRQPPLICWLTRTFVLLPKYETSWARWLRGWPGGYHENVV
jgi:hypothetical protein